MGFYESICTLNRLLSIEEKKQLDEIIIGEEAHIARIDSGEIQGLEFERQEHAARVNKLKALYVPVHRLPVELLGTIFSAYYLSEKENLPRIIEDDNLQASLLLCAVCQRWRQVAVSLPELWQSLCLNLVCPKDRSRITMAEAMITTWLSRASVSFPVAVSIGSSAIAAAEAQDDYTYKAMLSGLLRRYCSVISSIKITSTDITTPNCNVSRTVAARELDHLAEIQLLRDIFPLSTTSNPLVSKFELILNSPHSKMLNCLDREKRLTTIHLPWSQLIFLKIDLTTPGVSPTDASEIISLCPKLVQCFFRVITGSLAAGTTLPSVITTLPSLHTLSLYVDVLYGSRVFYSHFFDMLTMPGLKNLTVVFENLVINATDIDDRFMDFKIRSGLDLEIFHLHNLWGTVSPEAFMNFIAGMPSLSDVSIMEISYRLISEAFVTALTLENNQLLILAPGLRKLHISSPVGRDQPLLAYHLLEMLINMVESRCLSDFHANESGVSDCIYLEEVHIGIGFPHHDTWQEHEEILQRANACLERGLRKFTLA